jgi:hypothetical protein
MIAPPGAQVDVARMMAHLDVFARRVKLSGTPEELESFRYLEATLREYGFATQLILHDAYISLPGAAALQVDGTAIRCITHSFSRPSPPDGLHGEVVYVGHGTEADFAAAAVHGRIALIEGLAAPGPSDLASRHGAIGQIHISAHEHLHEMCISPVWGSPTEITRHRLPHAVVLTVSHADGAAMRERVRAGQHVQATMHAKVDTRWRKTPLLVAELGCEGEVPFVLFSGHHDTWHFGVMDNGSANATMLETARVCAGERARWRRGLKLCFWSGHSHGRYSGSTWYADHHWAELEARCVAHVNCDSTGGKGATVLTDTPSSTELRGLAADAVRTEGQQEATGLRMARAGDSSFWGIGIPSLFMGMGEQPAGEGANVAGSILTGSGEVRKGAGFGWWWHTPDDLLDKIDPELLGRDTRVYVHAVWRLLTDAVLPHDYALFAADLLRTLDGLDAALGAKLDLAALRARVALLRDRAAALSGGDPAKVNRAILGMARALVPIDYTHGNRFDHDPALKISAYPLLDPLRALAQAPAGSDAAKFAEVAAVRSVNRIAFAVEQAIAAAQL